MDSSDGSGGRAQGDLKPDDDALSQAFFRDRNVAEAEKEPGDRKKTILGKLALRVLPILLLLAVLDVVLRITLPPERLLPYMQKEVAFYTVKIDRFLEKPAPDVLFLGSSRMRDAVRPDIFSKRLGGYWKRPVRTFNLGLAGAEAEEWYTLLTSYMPDPPPPYIVIGFSGSEVSRVFEFGFASRFLWRVPNFCNYLKRASFDGFHVWHLEYFIELMICRAWYLFEQRDALSTLAAQRLEEVLGVDLRGEDEAPDEKETERIIAHVLAEDGYKPFLPEFWNLERRLKRTPEIEIKARRELNRSPKQLNEDGIAIMRLIVERCGRMGVKLAFVETPVSPYLQERNPVLHGHYFRKWMAGVAEELGVIYLPFPEEETGLTNASYTDTSHITQDGARRFTHTLFNKLRDEGFFRGSGR